MIAREPVDDVVSVANVDERVGRARPIDAASTHLVVAIFVCAEVVCRGVLRRRRLVVPRRRREEAVRPDRFLCTVRLYVRAGEGDSRDADEDVAGAPGPAAGIHPGPPRFNQKSMLGPALSRGVMKSKNLP